MLLCDWVAGETTDFLEMQYKNNSSLQTVPLSNQPSVDL